MQLIIEKIKQNKKISLEQLKEIINQQKEDSKYEAGGYVPDRVLKGLWDKVKKIAEGDD
jgi:hypothetical protein